MGFPSKSVLNASARNLQTQTEEIVALKNHKAVAVKFLTGFELSQHCR